MWRGIASACCYAADAWTGVLHAFYVLDASTWHTQHGTVLAQFRNVIDAIFINPFHLFVFDLFDFLAIRRNYVWLLWQALRFCGATTYTNATTITTPTYCLNEKEQKGNCYKWQRHCVYILTLHTIWHGFDAQAVNVEAAIALLAVQHFILILVSFAFDAALAVGALPIVVAHARHHAIRHLNAARVNYKFQIFN